MNEYFVLPVATKCSKFGRKDGTRTPHSDALAFLAALKKKKRLTSNNTSNIGSDDLEREWAT